MEPALISPAKMLLFGFIPTAIFSLLIPMIGVGLFAYIMAKRIIPLILASPDFRFDRICTRTINVLKLWLGQYRQPRYMVGGLIHILIFAGFIVLSIRSNQLVIVGLSEDFVVPGMGGIVGHIYNILKDYAATIVLITCIIAAVRRGLFSPERYKVPARYGKAHTGEAIFVLGMISVLMISESLFEASSVAASIQAGLHAEYLAPLSLAWFLKMMLLSSSKGTLQVVHILSYYVHDVTFFSFLCFLPMGKHFHVITSLFNVFFMKLDKGTIKPVKWGVTDEQLDDLESFGVKKFEDFTWKHMLDFYSCADCGRCSDQCPANAVGRPLSPRFISIKARELCFESYPLEKGAKISKGMPLIAGLLEDDDKGIYTEDEIWSCTTCGACEQECPIMIEYIDKIVDMRRGMVDEGAVPQSLQKPLKALEKRGNPWGKMEKKRAEWTKDLDVPVKILDKKTTADTLYFLDSITSYDDRIQDIAKATARVLTAAGIDFGILGKAEKDSGHEVRRFGEEMLFQDLKAKNTGAIEKAGVSNIVTTDPHAYNALKKDYDNLPPVEHISEVIAKAVTSGKIRLKPVENKELVFTYHDPCYLGRHNDMYDIPRDVLDAIPGLNRVDMTKSRDRSFCCGGGGLMLFYEPEEEMRMGQLRVEMAEEAGANVIVTACPFCMVNLEDAIKTSGLEGKMEAIDLVELIDNHLIME
ncbi:(Fe-S)-binding protein [Desulfobacterales bacterium HSG16]|nr:(Fe-S)-binding protein [Desulfobacterales bacterium HSG16]